MPLAMLNNNNSNMESQQKEEVPSSSATNGEVVVPQHQTEEENSKNTVEHYEYGVTFAPASERVIISERSTTRSRRQQHHHPMTTTDDQPWWRTIFCPEPVVIAEALPLYLCLAALILTHTASWSCAYFEGAEISITGGSYGLWTVQDSNGKCQLWDVLFFSYQWDPALEAARFLSMTTMLIGLALWVTMVQAQQAHYLCCAFGFLLVVLFVVSASTTSIFNVWIVFWLSTYVIFILIVRSLFVHPVFRLISKRGSKIIGYLLVFCTLTSILTLTVLKSDYCTCDIISTRDLEERVRNSTCTDNGYCRLDWGGYLMVLASLFWLASAVATNKVGVQPSHAREDPAKVNIEYFGYSRDSITTKVAKLIRGSFDSSKGEKDRDGGPENSDSNVVSNNDGDDSARGVNTKVVKLLTGSFEEPDGSSSNAIDPESGDIIDQHKDNGDGSQHDNSENGRRRLRTNTTDVSIDDNVDNDDEGDIKVVGSLSSDGMVTKEGVHPVVDGDNDEDDERKRNLCQRLCCDFRVTERSTREKWLFWSFRVALGLMVTIYCFLIALLIGSRWENRQAERNPSTSHFFITNVVCAFDPNDTSAPFQTFETAALANTAGYKVAHCGECAFCSNYEDIETYIRTRKTIAKTAKKCGMHAMLGTYESLMECLENRIGFTSPCTTCWADNMINTAEYCMFTCAKTMFTGYMSNNNVAGAEEGWLNQCLHCDEKRSGPDFVTCSGVARRRLGVASEIERNKDEQCPFVDVDWVDLFDD